jgi:hypothetical protein
MRRSIAASILAAVVCAGLAASAATVPYGPHVVYGIVKRIAPGELVVQTRTGRLMPFDITIAKAAGRTGVLYEGRAVALHGDYDPKHVYHVNAITSANGIRYGAKWPPDR